MTRGARLNSVILALSIAAVAVISVSAAWAQEPAAVPASLNLKDAPVREVLEMIVVKWLGADILTTDDVQGTISLVFSNKTPEEALTIIADAKNLHWWNENGVYVVSGKPRTAGSEAAPPGGAAAPTLAQNARGEKIYRDTIVLKYLNANYLAPRFGGKADFPTAAERKTVEVPYPYEALTVQRGNAAGPADQQSIPGEVPLARTTAARSGGPYQELQQIAPPTMPGVLTPGAAPGTTAPGTETAEQYGISAEAPFAHLLPEGLTPPVAFGALNALIVQGTAEAIDEFRKLVEALDQRVPQVIVEAQFVEMRVDDARQFGINWSWISNQTSVDVGGINSGGNISVSFIKGNFTALLQTLLNSSHARIINAPRLATMNNQPVTFQVSRTFFYFTTQTVVQTPTFAGSQVFTNNILNALPVVTSFTILPQVNGDNSITVDVTTVISDIAGFVTGPSGERIPEPTATSLPTRLRVDNGQTIVMGGFVRKNISTTEQKVPLLSEIPILGKLFRGTTHTQSDSELLIFLTANVLEEPTAALAAPGGVQFQRIPLEQ